MKQTDAVGRGRRGEANRKLVEKSSIVLIRIMKGKKLQKVKVNFLFKEVIGFFFFWLCTYTYIHHL